MAKALAAALVVGALAFGAIALSARGPGPREIRIVARDMTFYLEGQTDPNPTLRLRAGESVRLVLRNDDPGMTHDFAIPDWKAATRRIEGGRAGDRHLPRPGRALVADLPLPAAFRDHARYDTGRMTLRAALSSADSKAPYVRRLFHTIADRYDLITGLLSFGRDRRWKAQVIDLAGVRDGQRALDLAAGTGDIAFGLAARGARVVALDITHRMLQLASRKRPASAAVTFVTGDMMALPFPDARLRPGDDRLRHQERPGDRAGDRGNPPRAPSRRPAPVARLRSAREPDRPRRCILGYLTLVGSALGWVLHRDPDTYRYIPESIRRYPGAAGVAAMLARAGFDDSRVIPLLGGLMAINIATRRT